MSSPTGNMRDLQYPLDRSLSPEAITPNDGTPQLPFSWPTSDDEEQVTVSLTLSLSEYVALASCVDVGSDIAYGENAILLWWIWTRSINTMNFCEQVDDCVDTNPTTQTIINNMLLSFGLVNPDQIQPIEPQMEKRFTSAQRAEKVNPDPPACDLDMLWTGILEMVNRLDELARDFMEDVVTHNDKAERIANIIDIVPLFGDVAADTITIFADIIPDLLNAYNAHSSTIVLEDTACALFELVCEECRYPTFDEMYDHYASAGITGIDDIVAYGITGAMDFLIGSNNLTNAVVWYTANTVLLYVLYLGGTYGSYRGHKWLGIWANIGEDNPNNGWELLCDGCLPVPGWCYRFDLTTGTLPNDVTFSLECGFETGVANVGQVDSITEQVLSSCTAWASYIRITINLPNGTNTRGVRLYGGGVKGTNDDNIRAIDQNGNYFTDNNPVVFWDTGEFAINWNRSQDYCELYINTGRFNGGVGLGNSWLTAIEIWSDTGSNPFGADNCV